MSDVGAGNDYIGRRKHLGQLALVFKHRHGTWYDFGQFLKHLFSDSPRIGRIATIPLVTVACRHNSGGRHHATLTDYTRNPQKYPMFDHERYTRPCISIGAFEDKKNPGLVVADLCTRAKDFLLSIGKGDARQETGRDFDYNPPVLSSSPSIGSSQITDSQGALDGSNIIDRPRCPALQPDEYGGDELFGDEDVLQELEGIMSAAESNSRPPSSSSMETPSGFHASEDSLLQFTGRSSTKMRAATSGTCGSSPITLQSLEHSFDCFAVIGVFKYFTYADVNLLYTA